MAIQCHGTSGTKEIPRLTMTSVRWVHPPILHLASSNISSNTGQQARSVGLVEAFIVRRAVRLDRALQLGRICHGAERSINLKRPALYCCRKQHPTSSNEMLSSLWLQRMDKLRVQAIRLLRFKGKDGRSAKRPRMREEHKPAEQDDFPRLFLGTKKNGLNRPNISTVTLEGR
jgi:hypothetical protein